MVGGGEIAAIATAVTALVGHGALMYYKMGKVETEVNNHTKAISKLADHLQHRCPLCKDYQGNPGKEA